MKIYGGYGDNMPMSNPDQKPKHILHLKSSLKKENLYKTSLRGLRIEPYFKIKHRPMHPPVNSSKLSTE
jgi:hypothetical protein